MRPHPTLRLALTVLAGLVALASLLGFYSSNLLFRPRWYHDQVAARRSATAVTIVTGPGLSRLPSTPLPGSFGHPSRREDRYS